MASTAFPSGSGLVVVQLTDTHLFADPQQKMLGCPTHGALQRVLSHRPFARRHLPHPNCPRPGLMGSLGNKASPHPSSFLSSSSAAGSVGAIALVCPHFPRLDKGEIYPDST